MYFKLGCCKNGDKCPYLHIQSVCTSTLSSSDAAVPTPPVVAASSVPPSDHAVPQTRRRAQPSPAVPKRVHVIDSDGKDPLGFNEPQVQSASQFNEMSRRVRQNVSKMVLAHSKQSQYADAPRLVVRTRAEILAAQAAEKEMQEKAGKKSGKEDKKENTVDVEANVDGDAKGGADGDAKGSADGDGNTDVNTNADGNTDVNTNADGNTDVNTNADGNTDVSNSATNTNSSANTNVNANANSVTEQADYEDDNESDRKLFIVFVNTRTPRLGSNTWGLFIRINCLLNRLQYILLVFCCDG